MSDKGCRLYGIEVSSERWKSTMVGCEATLTYDVFRRGMEALRRRSQMPAHMPLLIPHDLAAWIEINER